MPCIADERGSISFATVFALLLLTMLLGMVINTGRQIDSKVKLQNAADAATYSSGVVLARGMNTLAYSNHLLCEVMAMTAFLREGRDRHADPLVPEILAAWDRIGPVLERSGFEKFEALGQAIPQKTPLEQEMVDCLQRLDGRFERDHPAGRRRNSDRRIHSRFPAAGRIGHADNRPDGGQ